MDKTHYTKRAQKGLLRMPQKQARRMKDALNEIGDGNADGKNIVRLQGRPGFRLRRGGYRAIYKATREGILVLDVGPRGDIYR